VQPRFGIGGYFPGFIGAEHAPYSLLAEANFTVAHMGSDIPACENVTPEYKRTFHVVNNQLPQHNEPEVCT
jgi:hypothetical protein